MKFYQTYFIDEYKFGKKGITFIVSDNYSELVSVAGGVQTDIVSIENFKQDLNLSEAEFAVDELSFSVNGAAANKETDANCLAFLLEAKSSQRFVALYLGNYGSVLSSDNLLFLGKIDNKVTGDDLKWTGGNFATLINPIRVYKFSALSLDIALLEDCVFNGDVYNANSVRVDNIYDRLNADDKSAIWNICNDFYSLTYFGNKRKLPHVVKLYDAIQLFLSQASAMLGDLHGITVSFNLLDAELPFKGNPVYYDLQSGTGEQYVKGQFVKTENAYSLYLNTVEDNSKRNIYIDGRLLHANLDRPYWNDTDADTTLSEKANYQRERYYSERAYSFYNYGNVSTLLFEIARALGCYLTTNYTIENGTLTVNVGFTSRQNLTETQNTYMIGAADANIDTGAGEADGANAFYGKANDLLADGEDIITLYTEMGITPAVRWSEKTQNSTDAENLRNKSEKKHNTTYSRLALTTSQSLYNTSLSEKKSPLNDTKPINIVTVNPNRVIQENLKSYFLTTTAIYINDVPTANDIRHDLNPPLETTAMRPIGKVFATIDNEPIKSADGTDGVQLSEYINIIAGRDKSFFETQYEITVPFWSGFSKNADGSNAAWNKVKLGSIIELNEKIRKYENGEWSDYTPENGTQFVVVSKDIALDKPETKLTLQNISRFAYGTYTPTAETQVLGKCIETVYRGENIESASIATGENISVGDAVSMNADGKIYKTICNTNYRGQFVGVAVQATNELIAYQTAGVVSNPYFEFIPQMPIFVRNVNDGMPNISQQYRGNYTPIINENLVIRLGYPISSTSFQLDYKEYEVQYREPH